MSLEGQIRRIVVESVAQLGRDDLYREPVVAFSAADDPRYEELRGIVGDWVEPPRTFLPSVNSVISFFVPYVKEVAHAPKTATRESPVWGEAYVVINDHFEQVNRQLCDFLRSQGYDAEAVPATHTYSEVDLKSKWSHRSAAVIANLAYFSANRMAVTEKGSAGRFCTVFTSAKLACDAPALPNRCPYLKNGKCGKCFDACPVGALKPDSFAQFTCLKLLHENEDAIEAGGGVSGADTCGKCIAACPLAYFE